MSNDTFGLSEGQDIDTCNRLSIMNAGGPEPVVTAPQLSVLALKLTFAFGKTPIAHITELVSLIAILRSSNWLSCSIAWLVKWPSDYAEKPLTLLPYS